MSTEEAQGNVFDQMQKSYETYIAHHQEQQSIIQADNKKLASRLSAIEGMLAKERSDREKDLKLAEEERDKLLLRIKGFEDKILRYEDTVRVLKRQIEEYKKELAIYKNN